MRRVLQNLIIAFTVIFLFTGMFLYRKIRICGSKWTVYK